MKNGGCCRTRLSIYSVAFLSPSKAKVIECVLIKSSRDTSLLQRQDWYVSRIRSTLAVTCYLSYLDREPESELPAVWTTSALTVTRPATVRFSVTVHRLCKSARRPEWSVVTTIYHRFESRAKGSNITGLHRNQQHDNNLNNNNSSRPSTRLVAAITFWQRTENRRKPIKTTGWSPTTRLRPLLFHPIRWFRPPDVYHSRSCPSSAVYTAINK